ncbi:MAG: hypothetical protein HQ568_08210, partial [Calditrichaeota bacterium]|nr:hypothetical protein [Calditrichota bacterium]
MSHFFKKSAPFLFILFTFTTVFAQDDFRRWQPEDGVAVRQGWHVEWNRSGISRTEGELAGEVGFVWSDCRNGYRDVYMQVISTDGEFKFDENGLRITSNQSHQEDPVIYPSSDGGWFISWWESFAIGYRDSINLYCTKINSEGERIWAIDEWIGVPVCVGQNIVHLGEGFSILCQIQEDNDGGCILVWQNQHIYEADIYAMHVNSEGELDENWEENGISVVAENGSQTQLDAISDGEGGMIIVWKDGRDDRDYNIWAQRITSNSELLWGNGIGVIVCSNDENQEKPKLCSDGANGAFIVWVDERNWNETHRDIYAQRINTDGELLWSEEGDAVCTVEREQSAVLIAASGEAEAIICWEDKRNERETTDIYSMLINGNDEMVKEWEPESGVPVVIADRYQNHVRICSDSEGGAYFVWEDERDGSFPEVDIDAQRINGEGSNVWEENGIPICTDVGAQLGPAICQTENSFTMAWADWSSGSFDLKIQRVSGEGEFVWEENRLLLVDGFDGFAQYPKLLSRGDGEFVLVWSDGRLGSRMYPFVQYCRDNGNEVEMLLQKDGQQVFSGTDGGCYYVEATLSDDGSVFAVWKDLRNEQAFSIYAQKLSEAGELQWGESGIRISEESIYEKNRPKICTDANG